jgi:hypothetical protein
MDKVGYHKKSGVRQKVLLVTPFMLYVFTLATFKNAVFVKSSIFFDDKVIEWGD